MSDAVANSSESFDASAPPFDGEVRHKRTRRRNPWPGLDLSDSELAATIRNVPLFELAGVLAEDDEFLAAVERVRDGADVDGIAKGYVKWPGQPRRVFCELLTRSASYRWPQHPAQPVLDLGVISGPCRPRAPDDPAEWTHAKRHGEAAEMLARIGAKRCIRCDQPRASDNRGRYCGPCQPAGPHAQAVERSDREAITNLLHAVGDALGIA